MLRICRLTKKNGVFSVSLRELKVSFQFYCLTTKQKITKKNNGVFSVSLRELKVSFQFYCLTTKQKIRKCSEP